MGDASGEQRELAWARREQVEKELSWAREFITRMDRLITQ
jgi:hypothetical protein